jgi:hypothetical protein
MVGMVLLRLLLLLHVPSTLHTAAAAVTHQAPSELLTQVHPPRPTGNQQLTTNFTIATAVNITLNFLQACCKLPHSRQIIRCRQCTSRRRFQQPRSSSCCLLYPFHAMLLQPQL